MPKICVRMFFLVVGIACLCFVFFWLNFFINLKFLHAYLSKSTYGFFGYFCEIILMKRMINKRNAIGKQDFISSIINTTTTVI